MVLDGAQKMAAVQTSPAAQTMVAMSIAESNSRLEFLEGELRKLTLKQLSEQSQTRHPTSFMPGGNK